jgi:hypothetical protein
MKTKPSTSTALDDLEAYCKADAAALGRLLDAYSDHQERIRRDARAHCAEIINARRAQEVK